MAGRDSGQSEKPVRGPCAGELTSCFALLVSVAGGFIMQGYVYGQGLGVWVTTYCSIY